MIHPAPPATFRDLVRRCRDARGENQREFAEASGGVISQQQVSHWERGHARHPRPDAIAWLAEACGTTPAAVLASAGYPGLPPALTDEISALAASSPALRDLLRAASGLSSAQVKVLVAVARAMRAG